MSPVPWIRAVPDCPLVASDSRSRRVPPAGGRKVLVKRPYYYPYPPKVVDRTNRRCRFAVRADNETASRSTVGDVAAPLDLPGRVTNGASLGKDAPSGSRGPKG